MSDLDLKDLRLVRAIAEQGGVTKAARHLHLSQSAVSHHLSRVEERLGVPLFRRAGRGLAITPAGQRTVEVARQVASQVSSLERELRRGTVRRKLRLATQCYTAYHWLPPLLTELQQLHPEVDVEIELQGTREPIEQLEAGQLDLAICHAQPPRQKSWQVRPLFEDPFVAVLPVTHALSTRKRIAPSMLAGETLLLYDLPAEDLVRMGRELFPDPKRRPAKVERTPLTEVIITLVRSGRGVSIMSRWAIAPYVSRGEVAAVPLTGRGARRHWRAVWGANTALTGAIESLVELIRRNDSLRASS